MREELSAFHTFFLKFIFSGLFLGIAGWLIDNLLVALFRAPGEVPPLAYIFVALWSGAAIAGCSYLTIPLKKVSTDGQFLYVSNYLKEIVVPLSDVVRVTQSRVFNIKPITVELNATTEFGSKIKFVPRTEMRFWLAEHPVVTELRSMVERSQARLHAPAGPQANRGLNPTADQHTL